MLDQKAVDNNDSQLSAPQPQERRGKLKRALTDIVETIVIALLLFLVINTISARIRVDGRSMEPTLNYCFSLPAQSRPGVHQAGDRVAGRFGGDKSWPGLCKRSAYRRTIYT